MQSSSPSLSTQRVSKERELSISSEQLSLMNSVSAMYSPVQILARDGQCSVSA